MRTQFSGDSGVTDAASSAEAIHWESTAHAVLVASVTLDLHTMCSVSEKLSFREVQCCVLKTGWMLANIGMSQRAVAGAQR
jgi:hypothetical protein